MLYPEDKIKSIWDMIMTIALLLTCIRTPLDIVFFKDSNIVLSTMIDLIFLIDMITIFNSAYYN